MARAFLGFGANEGEPSARLDRTLAALTERGIAVAACARPAWSAFVDADGHEPDGVPRVLNTVIEVETQVAPSALMGALLELEQDAGRVRDGRALRALDLDLLAVGDLVCAEPGLTLPHPRAIERAFVLRPWAEIAPCYPVPGTADTVTGHLHALWRTGRRDDDLLPLPTFPDLDGACDVLEDRDALDTWRAAQAWSVAVVPTMGALHDGHLSLMRRARAAGHAVLATLFVNPLQFGEGEDLERYPRTLDADIRLMRSAGVDAVYVPAPDALYPRDFSTFVVPEGPAEGFEGASRPGHFRGVCTIVTKLLLRTRPDVAYFGQKDAQQVAVIRRLVCDLDLPARLEISPTVRDVDGLALSSRNRYLSDDERVAARGLGAALRAMAMAGAEGGATPTDVVARGRAVLDGVPGARVDYVDLVDPAAFVPAETLAGPALAVAAAHVGGTHLIDNEWVVCP